MALFAVTFEYADEERKHQVRPKHREYLQSLLDQGKIYESGPFADESGAMLIYNAESEAEARELLAKDPYTANGVTSNVMVKEWKVVFRGDQAPGN